MVGGDVVDSVGGYRARVDDDVADERAVEVAAPLVSGCLPCILMIAVYDSLYRWPKARLAKAGQTNRLVQRFI